MIDEKGRVLTWVTGITQSNLTTFGEFLRRTHGKVTVSVGVRINLQGRHPLTTSIEFRARTAGIGTTWRRHLVFRQLSTQIPEVGRKYQVKQTPEGEKLLEEIYRRYTKLAYGQVPHYTSKIAAHGREFEVKYPKNWERRK